jgi:hypothetical protein
MTPLLRRCRPAAKTRPVSRMTHADAVARDSAPTQPNSNDRNARRNGKGSATAEPRRALAPAELLRQYLRLLYLGPHGCDPGQHFRA